MNDILMVEKNPTDNSKLILTINRQPIGEWFRKQWRSYGKDCDKRKCQEKIKDSGYKKVLLISVKIIFSFLCSK